MSGSVARKKKKRGKNNGCVINKIRNKTIHRMFAVIRKQEPYDKNYKWNTKKAIWRMSYSRMLKIIFYSISWINHRKLDDTLSPKLLSCFTGQKISCSLEICFFARLALNIVLLHRTEIKLHLRNIQINLEFRSPCTTLVCASQKQNLGGGSEKLK